MQQLLTKTSSLNENMAIKVTKIPNRLTNDLNKLQKYKMQTNMTRFPLSDSWSQSTCTQTRERRINVDKYWRYNI